MSASVQPNAPFPVAKQRGRVLLWWLSVMLAAPLSSALAQTPPTYRQPPASILALADAPSAPQVLGDSRGTTLVLLQRDAYPPLAELSAPELRLGGLRVDPRTHVAHTITLSDNRPRRLDYVRGLSLQRVGATPIPVRGLPPQPRLAYFTWSPEESRLAFIHVADDGAQVWLLELASGHARRLGTASANASLGNPLTWFRDGHALLVRALPDAPPALTDPRTAMPQGPIVRVSDGHAAASRTFQDLLSDPVDDANFEALTTSVLLRVPLHGAASRWAGPAMVRDTRFSPDGAWLLVETLQRPFSHRMPLDRFPLRHDLLDHTGQLVRTVAQAPASDDLPRGRMAVRRGRRDLGWRADAPATLTWVEALDGGDPARAVPFRDALYGWAAPFDAPPRQLLQTVNRLHQVLWGDDAHAVASDTWWDTRETRSYVFSPAHPGTPRQLFRRDLQDRYADPGRFSMRRNAYGEAVLRLHGEQAWLLGEGYSAAGQFPFVDRIDLASGQRARVYQSTLRDRAETLLELTGDDASRALVTIESPDDTPDYFLRDLTTTASLRRLTHFGSPYPSLRGVYKQVLRYRRADGLALSGVLYLPRGHDGLKRKLPLLIWAYPVEYKDKDSAAQITANPNRFTRLDFKSPLYWVTRGYAVLDKAAFPIIGEGEREPNDSYLPQLLANARAAIDAVDALGVIDRKQVAIGGHSYGAFMVANLLTHTDWFAAGIARSGAYNRTLTPFGFQREERSYWQAPAVYTQMSPFLHAERMHTPLLLIHGQDDGNAGTHTMQSERYFDALKALGAPARLVLLPREGHAYRARETVLHVLWEQDQWLQRHVRQRVPVEQAADAAPGRGVAVGTM